MATVESATPNDVKSTSWRRNLALYGVGVLVIAGLFLCARAFISPAEKIAAAQSGPQIVLPFTKRDFGQVQAGTVLQTKFAVRNQGSQRVVLYAEGCGGCGDESLVDSVIIPPNGQAQIPMKVETAGRSGPLRQVTTFTTSDPQQARVDFVLTAHVLAPDR